MDIEELEKRLLTINEEETNKIKKVVESYHNSQKVIKQLMDEHIKGRTEDLRTSVVEEEEDVDKRKYHLNLFVVKTSKILRFNSLQLKIFSYCILNYI